MFHRNRVHDSLFQSLAVQMIVDGNNPYKYLSRDVIGRASNGGLAVRAKSNSSGYREIELG